MFRIHFFFDENVVNLLSISNWIGHSIRSTDTVNLTVQIDEIEAQIIIRTILN